MNTEIRANLKNAIGYGRTSTSRQGNSERQHENLIKFASSRGYELDRFFSDTITGKSKTTTRSGYKQMLKYAIKNRITTIFFSEISRVGRRVSDVITTIETLVEEHGFTLYVQHPNELVFKADENGNIDILQKSMLMMLSLGAEMELHYQSVRRLEGIEIAKRENRYKGRIKGSIYSVEQLLARHSDIVSLVKHSTLADTKIAQTVGKGLSTVKRVKLALRGKSTSTHIN